MGRTASPVLPNRERGEDKDTMPTAETNISPTEQEIVEQWRAQELERAGYPGAVAAELATRPDVDLHRAVELLKKGCTPELAADILR
jgi:hypothetical protein